LFSEKKKNRAKRAVKRGEKGFFRIQAAGSNEKKSKKSRPRNKTKIVREETRTFVKPIKKNFHAEAENNRIPGEGGVANGHCGL